MENSCQRRVVTIAILIVLALAGWLAYWVFNELMMEEVSFVSDRDGNWEIYLIRADGNNLRRLTNQPADDFDINWASNGRQLAFVSVPKDGPYEVHVLDIQNDKAQTVVAAGRSQDWQPAWSPAGEWIAYASYRLWDGSSFPQFDVYLVRPDGNEEYNLTNNPANDYEPAWSPDGNWIAFVSGRAGYPAIYLVQPDGAGLKPLTEALGSSANPVWSPDGNFVAFECYTRPNENDICVIDVRNGEWRKLTDHPANDRFPAWSPNGKELVFVSERDGNKEIYLVNMEVGATRNLTNHPAPDWDPHWSPSGARIAFTSERDGNREIYVMNASGKNVVRLTNDLYYEGWLAWRP